MNVLQIITAFEKEFEGYEVGVLEAIKVAERRRLELEAKYLPKQTLKFSSVTLGLAQAHLHRNGYSLEVVNVGRLWSIIEVNPITKGLLREIHIEGIEIDPNAPLVVHDTTDDTAVDFERIG